MLRGVIADPAHHVPNRDVIRVVLVLRDEADMARDALDAQGRRKVAHFKGAAFAFGAGFARNEPHGSLHGRDIGVILTAVSRKDRDDGELLLRQCLFPADCKVMSQVCASGNPELPAANAQGLDLGEAIALGPEHYADFTCVQMVHGILPPFSFLASTIKRVSLTAAADSAGGHSSGIRPLSQQSMKCSISA